MSRILPLVGASILVLAGLTSPASGAIPVADPQPQAIRPDVSPAQIHDVSKPLTDMGEPSRVTPGPDSGRPGTVIPNKPLPGERIDDILAGNPGPPYIPDPTAPPPESLDMPTATSFEGIFNRNGVYPPDPDGDVGPNHYVQMVNLSLQVFSKSGTSLYGPVDGNVIWTGFPGDCATTNDGDPIVLYDQFADRWLVSQFSVGGPGLHECVAISTTPDPTGAWYRYQFSYDDFPDYPKFGVWPDGYYVTYNMFNEVSFDFLGAKVCAMDRAKMLAGLAATQQCFDRPPEWSLLPSDADGTTPPPAGSPNYMLGEHWSDQNRLTMYKFAVNWTTPAKTTLTGPIQIPVNAFTWACINVTRGRCVPQNNAATTQRLESLGGRTMYRLAYRNYGTHESLVTNHSVAMDGNLGQTSQLGIGWYELRSPNAATPTVYQQGTTADPNKTTFRWMGSMAQDKQGNMALGYSASSTTTYPSIRYNGRLVSDPLNQLPQAEGIIFSGTGAQTGSAGRWGDYSSMHTDPLDDCTFWYTNEYVQTTGGAPWRTRVGRFKYPGCTGTATVPKAPVVTATGGNAQVRIDITAPANGGNPINRYVVTASPGGAKCNTRVGVDANPLRCTFTGLTNGQKYTFSAKAVNAVGQGAAGTATATPATVPGAPTAVSGVPGAGQVVVSWTAPGSNGGAAISGYRVSATPGGAFCTSATTSCTVKGLTNGTGYRFKVKAQNAVGFGPESAASAVVTPRSVPGAPTAVSGVPGDGQVVVSWTASSSNGAAISGYRVSATPGGATCESATTSCTVPGLTNGTAYTFQVWARNALGEGPQSAPSASVVPFGAPGAPTAVQVEPGVGEAVVSWLPPADTGGLPIVMYRVTASPGGATCETTGTTCTVKGLTNGQAYTFTVVAITAGGSGKSADPGAPVTPEPAVQTALVTVPKKIKYEGKTVLLSKAVVTNAGQQATAKVKVKPKASKYSKARISKRGKVTIRTFGEKKLTVTLTLSAPATASYTSYSFTRQWTVKKKK